MSLTGVHVDDVGGAVVGGVGVLQPGVVEAVRGQAHDEGLVPLDDVMVGGVVDGEFLGAAVAGARPERHTRRAEREVGAQLGRPPRKRGRDRHRRRDAPS